MKISTITAEIASAPRVDLTGDEPIPRDLIPAQRTTTAAAAHPLIQAINNLGQGTDTAAVAFQTAIRAAVAESADQQATLTYIAKLIVEEQHLEEIRQSAHLPGCTGHLPDDDQICAGPVTSLPIPDGLSVPEGNLLEVSLTRHRDPEHPEDEVFLLASGNGVGFNQAEAEQFADQLISFAATVRQLARQAGTVTEHTATCA